MVPMEMAIYGMVGKNNDDNLYVSSGEFKVLNDGSIRYGKSKLDWNDLILKEHVT